MHHQGPIAGIATHGNYVATAGYCNQVILWDAERHTALARASHDHLVNQCAFNHAGTLLVSASSDHSARLWQLPSMRLQAVLNEHQDDVDMAVFSPDDQRIATGALDRKVRIFNLDGHCELTMAGHTGNVLSLAWSHDGQRLVSSSVDGTLRSWCARTGAALHNTDLEVRTDSVAIDRHGRIWAGDDRGRVVSIAHGKLVCTAAHRAGIKKIVLDEQQQVIVSLSYDRSLAVWRIEPDGGLRELARSTCPAEIWARAAAVMSDARLAVGTFGHTYAVFDWLSGRWDLTGVAAGPAINAVLPMADGVYTVGDAGVVAVDGEPRTAIGSLCNFLVETPHRILTGGQLGALHDARSGALLYQHHSPLNCAAAFLRNGAPHVAVGTYTGEILVFATGDGACFERPTVLSVYENAVKGLAANGEFLLSVCASTAIAWHHVNSLDQFDYRSAAHERIANACCALGNAGFASVGRDRVLRLWSAHGDSHELSPHPNSVKCVAVDDARSMIMTGSYGGTLAAFELGTRRWTRLQRPTSAGISSLAWDRHKRRFVAGAYDGGVYAVQP